MEHLGNVRSGYVKIHYPYLEPGHGQGLCQVGRYGRFANSAFAREYDYDVLYVGQGLPESGLLLDLFCAKYWCGHCDFLYTSESHVLIKCLCCPA